MLAPPDLRMMSGRLELTAARAPGGIRDIVGIGIRNYALRQSAQIVLLAVMRILQRRLQVNDGVGPVVAGLDRLHLHGFGVVRHVVGAGDHDVVVGLPVHQTLQRQGGRTLGRVLIQPHPTGAQYEAGCGSCTEPLAP